MENSSGITFNEQEDTGGNNKGVPGRRKGLHSTYPQTDFSYVEQGTNAQVTE